MERLALALGFLALGLAGLAKAPGRFEKDVIPTSQGDLEITFLGHASLMLVFGGKTIQVDPFGEVADYSSLAKADLVLVTHDRYLLDRVCTGLGVAGIRTGLLRLPLSQSLLREGRNGRSALAAGQAGPGVRREQPALRSGWRSSDTAPEGSWAAHSAGSASRWP